MFMPVSSLKEASALLDSCEECLYLNETAIKTVGIEMGVCQRACHSHVCFLYKERLNHFAHFLAVQQDEKSCHYMF